MRHTSPDPRCRDRCASCAAFAVSCCQERSEEALLLVIGMAGARTTRPRLSAGVDKDVRDRDGDVPLHWAAHRGVESRTRCTSGPSSDAQNLRPPVLSHGSPVRRKAYILRRVGLLCFPGDDGRALVDYSGSGLPTLHLDRKPTRTTLLASATRLILLLGRRVVSVRSANFRVCAAWCPCASAPACTSQALNCFAPICWNIRSAWSNWESTESTGTATDVLHRVPSQKLVRALTRHCPQRRHYYADSAGRMLAKKNDRAPDTPEQLVASGRDHGLPVQYSVARKHKCSKNVPCGRAASPHLHNHFFSDMSTACHGPAYLSSMVCFSARFRAAPCFFLGLALIERTIC